MSDDRHDVFQKMATGIPIATYRKTHLGKVHVRVLNSFDHSAHEIDLVGNPHDPACVDCYVDLWDEKELMYFKKSNKKHLDSGALVEAPRPEVEVAQSMNNISDIELEELVKGKFFGLKAAVEQMTTEEALIRVISLAEKLKRPEATMTFLRERLALIQSGELDADNSSG